MRGAGRVHGFWPHDDAPGGRVGAQGSDLVFTRRQVDDDRLPSICVSHQDAVDAPFHRGVGDEADGIFEHGGHGQDSHEPHHAITAKLVP